MAAVALYLVASVPAAWAVTHWHHARAGAVENLIAGVEQARKLHPGKLILLTGVSSDLFFTGIVDVPFRALEIPQVYLAPGSENSIHAAPDLVSKFELPEGMARKALDEDRAVVYDASGEILRNVTALYRVAWQAGPPRIVNPGDPIFDGQLSGDWEAPRNGMRRMGRSATVRIAGPRNPGEQLHVGVYCDAAPLKLEIGVEGKKAVETLARCDQIQIFVLPLAPGLGQEITVTLEAEPAGRAIFGYLEVR
jgi:hypothetical protein